MRARIQKWGNSLAVRIPRTFATDAGIDRDTPVEIGLNEGAITIRPVVDVPFDLDVLVAGITADNLHGEVDTGEPIGREAW